MGAAEKEGIVATADAERKETCLMKRWFALSLSMIAMLSLLFPVSAMANSAQTHWRGTSSTGAILSGEDCPIIVEHESLSFDIPEFPQQHYADAEDFLNLGADRLGTSRIVKLVKGQEAQGY